MPIKSIRALIILSILLISQTSFAQSITAVYPTSADQGDSLDVKILASSTHFENGTSVAVFSGNGITVTETEVVDATHAIANINIDDDAAIGARDVNVITGAETPEPLAGGFTVNRAAPTVTSITPNIGSNLEGVDVTELTGTHVTSGATVKLTKAGEDDIVATRVEVESSEKISCTFNLSQATAGLWDVYVENSDGQSGTLFDGFEITNGYPITSIAITKSGPAEASIGDTITFSFTAKNNGNEMLFNVEATDPMLGDDGAEHIGTLDVGETYDYTKNYTIPEGTSSLDNTAAVSGSNMAGDVYSDVNAHVVAIITTPILIGMNGPGVASAGDTSTYEFTITNNMDEAMTDVAVTDPLFGADWSHEVGDLAAGAAETFTQDYDIPLGASFPITNTSTVTATDAFETQVTDTASYTLYEAGSSTTTCTNSLSGQTASQSPFWVFLVILSTALLYAIRSYKKVG